MSKPVIALLTLGATILVVVAVIIGLALLGVWHEAGNSIQSVARRRQTK